MRIVHDLATIVATFCILGASSFGHARGSQASLDDIELDVVPAAIHKTTPTKAQTVSAKPVLPSGSRTVAAKPNPTAKATTSTATATATKSGGGRKPARSTASVDDIELDDSAPVTPVVDTVPDSVKLVLAAADIHEKDRDYKAVITSLKPKTDQLPRSGLLQLARACSVEKDSLCEIHSVELVVAKNPKDYVAQALLGDAYLKVDRVNDAATAFGAARDINAKYRPAYLGALQILLKAQELYEARVLVADIIKIFGPDAKMTAELCRMYSGESFVPEKSESVCRAAIAKDPRNPDNYVYLTQALVNTGQKPAADQTISNAAKRFPASEVVQTLAGSMKIDDRSFADSYRYFETATKAAPTSGAAWVGLAKSAFELQKHDEAIEDFVKACKLERRTTLDFRQAAQTLKKNKDAKWTKYQDAIDDRCD